jgi:hypothetical protein
MDTMTYFYFRIYNINIDKGVRLFSKLMNISNINQGNLKMFA